MSKPFFPSKGQPVVPLVRVGGDDELTHVKAKKIERNDGPVKLNYFRFAIGSIFKLTVVSFLGPRDNLTISNDGVQHEVSRGNQKRLGD
jgi:hypothetical protein